MEIVIFPYPGCQMKAERQAGKPNRNGPAGGPGFEDPPPYLWAGVTALAIGILYAVTLSPGTAFWDTSEYIATAHILGHPASARESTVRDPGPHLGATACPVRTLHCRADQPFLRPDELAGARTMVPGGPSHPRALLHRPALPPHRRRPRPRSSAPPPSRSGTSRTSTKRSTRSLSSPSRSSPGLPSAGGSGSVAAGTTS